MQHRTRTSLLLAATLTAATACASGTPTASPSSTASAPVPATSTAPTTSPQPEPTTTLAVVQYPSGPTYLTGRIDDFEIEQGQLVLDDKAVAHSRDGTISYHIISADPRVTGTVKGTWNSDRWGNLMSGAILQWGTATLTNEHGSWAGDYSGSVSPASGETITRWWKGSGSYEGLTFHMWIVGPSFRWSGIVFPGPPPPVAAP